MKKPLALILLFSYFTMSAGVMVNFHYCMDRLASSELFSSKVDKCGRCGMEIHASDGCCRDEVKFYKVDDEQQKSASVSAEIFVSQPITLQPGFIAAPFYNFSRLTHFYNHSPPLLAEQDIYLSNCVFRL